MTNLLTEFRLFSQPTEYSFNKTINKIIKHTQIKYLKKK